MAKISTGIIGLGNIGYKYDLGKKSILTHAKAIKSSKYFYIKTAVDKNKSVLKSFQRDVLTDLNERVTVTSNRIGQKILDAKAFDNYLNGAGGERGRREALKVIFGNDYVKNLDILNKALQISSRQSPSRAAEGVVGNFFTDIIRARLGQFTTPGRIFTAARRLFAVASNRVIKEALLNIWMKLMK